MESKVQPSLDFLARLPKFGFAVIDCETTGLEDDARIIQLAVVFLTEQCEVEALKSSFLRASGSTGDASVQAIHNIMPADILGAPLFSDFFIPLLPLIQNRVTFAQFSKFDRARLTHELSLINLPAMSPMACTKDLSEFLGYGRLRLQEAAKKFEIKSDQVHRADSDALTTAQLLKLYLLKHPEKFYEYLRLASFIPPN